MSKYSTTTLYVVVICIAFLTFDHAPARAAGYQGSVYGKEEGGQQTLLKGVRLTFTSQSGKVSKEATTGPDGSFRIELPPGSYKVTAEHSDYEDYSSAPGTFTVAASGYNTADISLRKAILTTVLVIRHAERPGGSDPPLTDAGKARAKKLIHVLKKARIMAIFVTDTLRSQQTAGPLVTDLGLTAITYGNEQELKNKIFPAYKGKVVLVVGHSNSNVMGQSNTAAGIIHILGGDPNACDIPNNEFDNLCVVTICLAGGVKVLNLQYGAPSP
jgi:broad specificity phosphatase PhoE